MLRKNTIKKIFLGVKKSNMIIALVIDIYKVIMNSFLQLVVTDYSSKL